MLVVKSHIGGGKSHKVCFFDFLYSVNPLTVSFYSFIQWITGFLLTNKPLLFIYLLYYYIIFIIYY